MQLTYVVTGKREGTSSKGTPAGRQVQEKLGRECARKTVRH